MKKQRMMVNKKEVSSSQEYNTRRKMLLKLFEHKIEIRHFGKTAGVFLRCSFKILLCCAIALIFNLILPSIEYRSQVPK